MSKTKNLAIYRPNGAAAEYSTWACNLYNGCSHSCKIKALLGGDPKKAYHLFCQELDKYRDQITADGGLFFSFSTDPMLREEINLTMRCIEYAFSQQVPVIILTKATWWVREDWVIGSLYAHRDLLTIGFTLTGHDELEPCAPANVSRQTALIYLSKMQFRTFASMEPVIDFVSSLAIIRTIASDCQEFRSSVKCSVSPKSTTSASSGKSLSAAFAVIGLSVPIYITACSAILSPRQNNNPCPAALGWVLNPSQYEFYSSY